MTTSQFNVYYLTDDEITSLQEDFKQSSEFCQKLIADKHLFKELKEQLKQKELKNGNS